MRPSCLALIGVPATPIVAPNHSLRRSALVTRLWPRSQCERANGNARLARAALCHWHRALPQPPPRAIDQTAPPSVFHTRAGIVSRNCHVTVIGWSPCHETKSTSPQ